VLIPAQLHLYRLAMDITNKAQRRNAHLFPLSRLRRFIKVSLTNPPPVV
jgi:hypothetical protein